MTFQRYSLPLLVALALALVPTLVLAQAVPPDAGQSIRELERPQLELPPSPALELQAPVLDGPPAAADGPTVHVSAFRITGNKAVAEAELQALLADLTGRTLSLGELQAATQRLSAHYRAQGYPLARAYLPAQEVADGIVELAVLEGRYGEVQVENPAGLGGAAFAPLEALTPGAAVRAAPLERSLLLLADIPGVEVDATLRPGASVGATDLIVNVLPGPRLTGSVDLDNHGGRYTGAWRLGGTLNLNNPLYLGDALSLRVMASEEAQQYLRAGYQVPVGRWGTRLGAAYSYMDYELGEDFADLDAEGTARIASLYATQPLRRSRALSLYATLQYDDKRLKDEVKLFGSRNDKDVAVWIASLTGDSRDGFAGGGVNSFSLSYAAGDLGLNSPLERLQDSLTARSHGSFSRVNLALLRLQRLPVERLSLSTRLQGQWSDDNLDSSEKFSLGGAYGVRAYPQGEAAGDRGWLANLDLNYALAPAWQAGLFADYGRVSLNAQPWTTDTNHRELSGAGVSTRWTRGAWRVDASAAWRLDSAPQSERDRKPRIWAQAVRYF